MIKKFRKYFVSFIAAGSSLPILFSLSCSASNPISCQDKIEQTKQLEDFFKNENPFSSNPNPSQVIKNFLNLTWKNLDELVNGLEQFFTIEPSFRKKLSENNNSIYNKIKKITIQPKENSRDLNVIFYLNCSSTDTNIVSLNVLNALNENFVYKQKISILNPDKIQTEKFNDNKEFDNFFKEAVNKKNFDKEKMNNLLKRAFNLSSPDWATQENLEENFNIFKISNAINLSLTKKGIDNGWIIDIEGSKTTFIESGALVK